MKEGTQKIIHGLCLTLACFFSTNFQASTLISYRNFAARGPCTLIPRQRQMVLDRQITYLKMRSYLGNHQLIRNIPTQVLLGTGRFQGGGTFEKEQMVTRAHLFTACTSILAFFNSAVIWSLFIVSCAALKSDGALLVCFVLCCILRN